MAYRDPVEGRCKNRERVARRTAQRRLAGLCPRCGRIAPAPDRSLCEKCASKRNRSARARDARLRAAGKPRRDPAKARAAKRRNSQRKAQQWCESGLCSRCGKLRAVPERTLCEPCLEKRRAADRARYRAAKAAGLKYGGADIEAKRRSGRAKSRRRQKARIEAGLCVRCGQRPPSEGGTTCAPCRDRRQAVERRQYAERKSGERAQTLGGDFGLIGSD